MRTVGSEIVVGAEPWSLFGISVVDPRSAEGELVQTRPANTHPAHRGRLPDGGDRPA